MKDAKYGNTIKRVKSKTDFREISIKIVGKKYQTTNEIKERLDKQTNLAKSTTPKVGLLSFLSYRVVSSLNFCSFNKWSC